MPSNNVEKREKTLRKIIWYFVKKIQALQADVVCWPENNFGDDIWIGCVDGTHIRTYEPKDENFPKNRKAFSYKNHSAGLDYELMLSLYESKCVWMNGPFLAGENDTSIFGKSGGLAEKLRELGKKVIADNGYRGYDDVVSRPNSQDSQQVRDFKTRARQRQESYNGKLKNFGCLDGTFRHGKERFAQCFEAVVAITQLKMELAEPVFDI